MNYKWHYDKLIETRKNRKLIPSEYYEKHHIKPKSMGGDNSETNLIHLTAREHFLAHWLLWRIYQNKEMAFAFKAMCKWSASTNNRIHVSGRIYEEARKAVSKKLSESQKEKVKNGTFIWMLNKKCTPEHRRKIFETRKLKGSYIGAPGKRSEETKKRISEGNKGKKRTKEQKLAISERMKGKKMSNEEKYKLSERMKGNKYWVGKHHTEEAKKKISKFNLGIKKSEECKQKISSIHKGKPKSEEHKLKLSKTQKGLKLPKVECPYCKNQVAERLKNRYHFENCKEKDKKFSNFLSYNCKNCGKLCEEKYASGIFCSKKCACSNATRKRKG